MEAQNQEAAALVQKIAGLHAAISKLPSLSPSPDADALFTALIAACVPPSPVDVAKLGPKVQSMRGELVRLCSDAEALLEARCSDALAALDDDPLDHLRLFPYYDSYAGLSELEHGLLSRYVPDHLAVPARVAFLGSGSLPLSSLLLAARHMPDADIDNYDRCAAANDRARRLVVRADDDGDQGGVGKRMSFRTADVEDLTHELAAYDVVFLAAPVGVTAEEKARVIAHLGTHMAVGAALVVRSAHGARGFLCSVVEPVDVGLGGFNLLAVYHPDNDEVINSIIVARKVADGCLGLAPPVVSPPCRCCEVEAAHSGTGRRLPPTSCHLDAMDEIRRRAW